MKQSKIIFPILFICLLICSNAFSQKVWKDQIPPEFDTCQGCILVVFKKEADENKKLHNINEIMEKNFMKNYEGKYVFVTPKELDTNTLYADKNIYRFVLNCATYTVSQTQRVDKGNNRTGEFNYKLAALKMQLWDRFQNKWYQQLSNWPSWPKNMEKVAEALNKLVKE